jgi:hypothetical protein
MYKKGERPNPSTVTETDKNKDLFERREPQYSRLDPACKEAGHQLLNAFHHLLEPCPFPFPFHARHPPNFQTYMPQSQRQKEKLRSILRAQVKQIQKKGE